jgi:ABC-2 type transport system permease protein
VIGFIPLLKKELREQLRTYRLVIVAGVFLFFGITTPLLLKYLPEIVKLAGENVPIEIPPPTAAQSLLEYAGTIGQIGVLVAVLVAMGSVANERSRGTAVMTLSKPVTRGAFVGAKWTASSLTFLASLAVASLVCLGYTVWLIGPPSAAAFTGQNLLLALFLLFCLALTVYFSSLFRSSLAAGGIALALIIAQAALSVVPVVGDFLPSKLLTWGNNLVNGSGPAYPWSLAVSAAATAACLFFAQRALKRNDL